MPRVGFKQIKEETEKQLNEATKELNSLKTDMTCKRGSCPCHLCEINCDNRDKLSVHMKESNFE